MVSQALIQQAVAEAANEVRERTSGKLSDADYRNHAENLVATAIRFVTQSEERRRHNALPCSEGHKNRLKIKLSSADISDETVDLIVAELLAEKVL